MLQDSNQDQNKCKYPLHLEFLNLYIIELFLYKCIVFKHVECFISVICVGLLIFFIEWMSCVALLRVVAFVCSL